MIKLTNVSNRDYEAGKKSHVCFKKFNDPENIKAAQNSSNQKY